MHYVWNNYSSLKITLKLTSSLSPNDATLQPRKTNKKYNVTLVFNSVKVANATNVCN